MEEDQTPNSDGPTPNLDANSRIIQPPTSGEGINAPRPEPPKHQTYQPQPTATPVLVDNVMSVPTHAAPPVAPSQSPTIDTAPQPQPNQVVSNPVPAYADPAPDPNSTPPRIQRDYVPGGVYVIAAVMMLPAIHIVVTIIEWIAAYGFSKTLLLIQLLLFTSPNLENPILPYLAVAAAGAVGCVMLFKQKRIGRIIAIVLASVLSLYGIYLVIRYATAHTTAIASSITPNNTYLLWMITLNILLPIGVILYLVRQKVCDFVSY